MSHSHTSLKKVAITGGIGSGKSALSECFAKIGYPVFDADRLLTSVVQQPSVQTQLTALLGSNAFISDTEGRQTYNRTWVREQVFADTQKRIALEGIVHPAIFNEFNSLCRNLEKTAGGIWVFYEAALIFESGRESNFDAVVAVCADEEIRRARLVQHRKLSHENISAIFAAQVTDRERRTKANFVIDNSGSKVELSERALELVVSLRQFFHPKSR
jgi:dephospho-CoA kinase